MASGGPDGEEESAAAAAAAGGDGEDLPLRFPYQRPEFLNLSAEELLCSADHISRPILIVKENNRLPWCTGYAE